MNTEHLTRRETDILRLLTASKSNQEIAESLVICEQSVSNRISTIMRKLGYERRIQLAIYALKTGIIRLDDIEL